MLTRIILLILFIAGTAWTQNQSISLHFTESDSREDFIGATVYIIDPVDSSVIGNSRTDFDGKVKLNLLHSLKSDQFCVAICNVYAKDTLLGYQYQPRQIYDVEWPMRQSLFFMTVGYGKKGIEHHQYELDLFGCKRYYGKSYQDSLEVEINRKALRAKEDYQRRYNEYLKYKAYADSVNQYSSGEDRIIYPVEPVEEVVEDFFPMTEVSQLAEPAGGYYQLYDKVFQLRILKPIFAKRKNFSMVIFMHGFEMHADSIIVEDADQRVFKRSKKMSSKILPLLDITWHPMMVNGKAIHIKPEVGLKVEFIYQKE